MRTNSAIPSKSSPAAAFVIGLIAAAAMPWPVTAAADDLRYRDNGDGTVIDGVTGLMWEKKLALDDPACASQDQSFRDVHCMENRYTWSAVEPFTEPTGTLYSDFLDTLNDLKAPNDGFATPCFAGHCDWRIPTIRELRSILIAPYPLCPSLPCIDPVFGPTVASPYWSSTPLASTPGKAWFVNFAIGFVNNTGTLQNAAFYARAVRDL